MLHAISRQIGQLPKILRRHVWGIGTIAFFLLLKASGVTQIWSLNQLDWMLSLGPQEPIDSNIVIIKIDQSYQAWLREQHGDRSYLEYQDLADLTQLIWAQNPAIVALDIPSTSLSGDGKEALLKQFRTHGDAMITTEKAVRPVIPPIEGILETQIASSDLLTDSDGKARRVLMGTYGEGEKFKKSLSFHISELYLLKQYKIESSNGLKDEKAVRFNEAEIPRLQPHQDPYTHNPNDIEGIQTLLYFRQQPKPFRPISAHALIQETIDPECLKDKIVLVGITTPEFTKYINTSVPRQRLLTHSDFQHEISGIEFQAHAISQIINATLDEKRVLLSGTHWVYSYGVIVGTGLLGLLLGRSSKNIFSGLLIILVAMLAGALGLWLLLIFCGLYISVMCAFLNFALTGIGSAIALQQEIARQESKKRQKMELQAARKEVEAREALLAEREIARQESEKRKNTELQATRKEVEAQEALLAERLKTLEDTFAELHNGPLQVLALLLRQVQDRKMSIETIEVQLKGLNRQIREVGEHLKQEAKVGERQVLLHGDQTFDLSQPLHELFYDVYYQSLQTGWPNLNNLKVRSRSFDPVPKEEQLTLDQKQALCQFLGEAICNVGKHAEGATRLTVSGKVSSEGDYILSIQDNGNCILSDHEGGGTQQAQKLATCLNGNFSRTALLPRGVRCMFRWPVEKT